MMMNVSIISVWCIVLMVIVSIDAVYNHKLRHDDDNPRPSKVPRYDHSNESLIRSLLLVPFDVLRTIIIPHFDHTDASIRNMDPTLKRAFDLTYFNEYALKEYENNASMLQSSAMYVQSITSSLNLSKKRRVMDHWMIYNYSFNIFNAL
jgi:hypothetical protein